jgi:hypothetical protein
MTPHSPHDPAALEQLAAALSPLDFAAILVTGDSRVPHLHVTSRHAQLGDDIYAQNGSFWWSWAERIGPLDDPLAAARKVAAVLRAAPEPSHG